MIAAWMVYVAVITVLSGLVALAAEWALRAMRFPARFAWLAAIVLIFFFAALAAVSHPASQAESNGVLSQRIAPATATNGLSTPPSGRIAQSNSVLFIEPSSPLVKLDVPLMIVWGVASIVGLLAIISSAIRIRILRRKWREEIIEGVPVYVSHDVGPAVSGIISYSIVVPQWIFDIASEHRRLIIAHEREHIREADPGALFIGALAIVAMPWNVVLWYVVRRLQMATEIDCDQRVLKLIPEPVAYANLLLDVGERALTSTIPIAALAERPSLLQTRIEKMTEKQPRSPWMKSALAATGAAAVFFVACQTPRPYSTTSPSERIPKLASELTALMHNDSVMESLSPEQRVKIRNQLDSALDETKAEFVLTGRQLDSLVELYYPAIAASPPVAGTLLAFVFDGEDRLIHHTAVPGLRDDHMDAMEKLGELFPDIKDRKVWTSGIAMTHFDKRHKLGEGQTIIIWESFRDPNSAYAMKHRNRLPH